jgi:hypothetical protein
LIKKLLLISVYTLSADWQFVAVAPMAVGSIALHTSLRTGNTVSELSEKTAGNAVIVLRWEK